MTSKAVAKKKASKAVDPFVNMVERLATNPDIDPDKLEKLVSIQMTILDRNAESDFNAAMARVQAKLPTVLRDAENQQTSSRYARHEAIARAIKPVYTAEGFSTSFSEGETSRESYIRIDGVLRHASGHSANYHIELPADDKGIKGSVNKTALHAAGSTFTYGRRYLTCLMFDVATGDDTDGNQPGAAVTAEQATELQALLSKVPSDVQGRFFKWALSTPHLTGEETPSDVPADKFVMAISHLEDLVKRANSKHSADRT